MIKGRSIGSAACSACSPAGWYASGRATYASGRRPSTSRAGVGARATCGPTAEGSVFTKRRFDGKETEERCTKSMGSNEGDKAQLGKCNVWVFCPTPLAEGGLCWSNDVWNHTYGECWLKHQLNPARPNAGAYGAYPAPYRKKHRTTPPEVQWMSGALSTRPVVVNGPHW